MSTELAVYGGASLPEKIEYARALAASGLLPESFRKQPENVLYAVEYGAMIGLPPMAAITGVNVIKGKPTASAGLIGALVRRAGHTLRVGFDAATMTGWARIIRSDDPEFTFESDWNLDRAVEAELCIKREGRPYAVDSKGQSLPWKKFYPSMVKARAITEVARDACEEVLFGLHYTPEELGAVVDEDGTPVAESALRRSRIVQESNPPEGTPDGVEDAVVVEDEQQADVPAPVVREPKPAASKRAARARAVDGGEWENEPVPDDQLYMDLKSQIESATSNADLVDVSKLIKGAVDGRLISPNQREHLIALYKAQDAEIKQGAAA